MQGQDFWSNHEQAGRISKELTGLKDQVEFWQDFEKKLAELTEADEIAARQLKKKFDIASAAQRWQDQLMVLVTQSWPEERSDK